MECKTCLSLQEELFKAKTTIAKQEGIIAMLKGTNSISTDKISFKFLAEMCDKYFDHFILYGCDKKYASYILDHIIPGKVTIGKKTKTVKYISEDGTPIEESMENFVAKILDSTKIKANSLFKEHNNYYINLFTESNDTISTDINKKFANMSLIRNCDNSFCKDVAKIIIKNS